MDKPFKCLKCCQCFANSDHLAVHQLSHQLEHFKPQKSLQVKIPGISSGLHADQTPTPTRFLRTAEVDGSQLFEEINPFEQDFQLASKQENSVEQHPSVGSTTGDENTSENLEHYSDVVHSMSVISSNQSEESQQKSSKLTTLNQNAVLQAVLKQLQQAKPRDSATTSDTALDTASTVTTSTQSKTTASQDLLREQLKALIKSGQIKIQFTSDPSSPKVQATIVGNVATKPSIFQPSVVSQRKQYIVPPKQVTNQSSVSSMSVLSVPTATIVSSTNMVHINHSDANLALAKQKLKQAIQANSAMDNNNLMNGRTTLVKSSQGKYKDIILHDERSNDSSGSEGIEITGKRKRSGEDFTPEEKRQKFLERNRAAASRCRQKRKVWVNQLEQKSDDLIQTNNQLMTEITSLRSEVAQLKGLLLAHKDCPVTLQQKALIGQLTNAGTYMAVSDGQIIAIHQVPNGNVQPSSAEELATSALTDMASRATIDMEHRLSSGTVTVQASDSSVSTLSSNLMQD